MHPPSAPAGPHDYEITPVQVVGQANVLDGAGDDLAAEVKPVLSLQGGSADVFGSAAAAAAYTNFLTHWKSELSIQVSALHELAGKIRGSAHSYDADDRANAASLMGIGPNAMVGGAASDLLGGHAPSPVGHALDRSTSFNGRGHR